MDVGALLELQSIYNAGGGLIHDNEFIPGPDPVAVPTSSPPVANYDFETGDFTSWTTSGVTSIRNDQVPWSGLALAQIGSATSQLLDSTVQQTFTVPTEYASLSFYYQVKCFDLSVTYDQFWVEIYDATTATTTTIVPQVCSNDGSWKHAQYALGSHAGHSVTIKFRTHDDGAGNYPTYAWVDNVEVQTANNANFESSTALLGWSSTGITARETFAAGYTPFGQANARVGSIDPYYDSSMFQTFTVPSSGVNTLAFTRKVVCLDSVTYAWANATLTDNVTGKVLTIMPNTCTNDGTWQTVTTSLGTMAGHSVTLKFFVHDDNWPGDPIHMLVDNVRLY